MIPIPVPVHSLAFGAVGLAVGVVTNRIDVGCTLAAVGSLLGYAIWLRARLLLIRDHSKSFNLGSALNVVACTTVAVGFGTLILMPTSLAWTAILSANGFAVWLHWRAARDAGTACLFPTAREVGRKAFEMATADEAPLAALKAVLEVGTQAVKTVKQRH